MEARLEYALTSSLSCLRKIIIQNHPQIVLQTRYYDLGGNPVDVRGLRLSWSGLGTEWAF